MKEEPFVFYGFSNPSGKITYRLHGWHQGQRFWKNIATRAEAEAERQVREVACLQSASGMRVAVTRLTNNSRKPKARSPWSKTSLSLYSSTSTTR